MRDTNEIPIYSPLPWKKLCGNFVFLFVVLRRSGTNLKIKMALVTFADHEKETCRIDRKVCIVFPHSHERYGPFL